MLSDIVTGIGQSSSSCVEYAEVKNDPPGVRFCPYPQELILGYLNKKNWGLALPLQIPELDFNAYSHPKDFPATNVYPYTIDNEMYYFSKYSKVRQMRDGFWKSHNGKEEIEDENGHPIGFMETFTFQANVEEESRSWIMKEFSDRYTDSSRGDGRWVLRVIYPIYQNWSRCSNVLTAKKKKTAPKKKKSSGPTREGGPGVSQIKNMSNAYQSQTNSPIMNEDEYDVNSYMLLQSYMPTEDCHLNFPASSDDGTQMLTQDSSLNENQTPNLDWQGNFIPFYSNQDI